MVDAGWKIDRGAKDAIELLRRLEPYNVFFLEDFMHPENYAGYAKVRECNSSIRIAAGEQEATGHGFRRLLNEGKVDIVQPDITRCGGFSEMRKIIWEAQTAGADVCPHAWLTDLNTAAALHINAILPRSLFLEYNTSSSPMLKEIIENPVVMDKDGFIAVPEDAGLGININEKAVSKYRVG
jgi:L-alanine-DL-glutamate epimerase-like enolase superfamily enzyme